MMWLCIDLLPIRSDILTICLLINTKGKTQRGLSLLCHAIAVKEPEDAFADVLTPQIVGVSRQI